MSMDQAATFLASSILIMLAAIIIIAGILIVNNLLNKYWKPINIFTPDSWKGFNPPHYIIESEKANKDTK